MTEQVARSRRRRDRRISRLPPRPHSPLVVPARQRARLRLLLSEHVHRPRERAEDQRGAHRRCLRARTATQRCPSERDRPQRQAAVRPVLEAQNRQPGAVSHAGQAASARPPPRRPLAGAGTSTGKRSRTPAASPTTSSRPRTGTFDHQVEPAAPCCRPSSPRARRCCTPAAARVSSTPCCTPISRSPPSTSQPVALGRYMMENPGAKVKHASILDLPFADGTFDGAFNLGVVEHFERPELMKLLKELTRVVRPGGKIVLFWPHRHATSVMFLNSVHFVLNDVLGLWCGCTRPRSRSSARSNRPARFWVRPASSSIATRSARVISSCRPSWWGGGLRERFEPRSRQSTQPVVGSERSRSARLAVAADRRGHYHSVLIYRIVIVWGAVLAALVIPDDKKRSLDGVTAVALLGAIVFQLCLQATSAPTIEMTGMRSGADLVPFIYCLIIVAALSGAGQLNLGPLKHSGFPSRSRCISMSAASCSSSLPRRTSTSGASRSIPSRPCSAAPTPTASPFPTRTRRQPRRSSRRASRRMAACSSASSTRRWRCCSVCPATFSAATPGTRRSPPWPAPRCSWATRGLERWASCSLSSFCSRREPGS